MGIQETSLIIVILRNHLIRMEKYFKTIWPWTPVHSWGCSYDKKMGLLGPAVSTIQREHRFRTMNFNASKKNIVKVESKTPQ